MTETTHTQAGLLAVAGAARLRAAALPASRHGGAALVTAYGVTAQHRLVGNHPASTWTKGAIAEPTAFMVFDGKNRPTRPLSELSP